MFDKAYQGGPSFEVLTTQGSNPTVSWKVAPTVQRVYDKAIRGYIYHSSQSATSPSLQLPKDANRSLQLFQPILVFQLLLCEDVQKDRTFTLELGVTDGSKTRRRVAFSHAVKDKSVNPLHARFPVQGCTEPVPRGQWINLCIDLPSVLRNAWGPSVQFKSLDLISISQECKLRKIFTLRSFAEKIPKSLDFPAQSVTSATVLVNGLFFQQGQLHELQNTSFAADQNGGQGAGNKFPPTTSTSSSKESQSSVPSLLNNTGTLTQTQQLRTRGRGGGPASASGGATLGHAQQPLALHLTGTLTAGGSSSSSAAFPLQQAQHAAGDQHAASSQLLDISQMSLTNVPAADEFSYEEMLVRGGGAPGVEPTASAAPSTSYAAKQKRRHASRNSLQNRLPAQDVDKEGSSTTATRRSRRGSEEDSLILLETSTASAADHHSTQRMKNKRSLSSDRGSGAPHMMLRQTNAWADSGSAAADKEQLQGSKHKLHHTTSGLMLSKNRSTKSSGLRVPTARGDFVLNAKNENKERGDAPTDVLENTWSGPRSTRHRLQPLDTDQQTWARHRGSMEQQTTADQQQNPARAGQQRDRSASIERVTPTAANTSAALN
ncbi:unnamed protein product, partial [Amoebophrya sp. A120]|eukprot:GSA120T00018498001.1